MISTSFQGIFEAKVIFREKFFFHVRCRTCCSSSSWEKMKGTSSLFKRQILMFSLRSKRNKCREGGGSRGETRICSTVAFEGTALHFWSLNSANYFIRRSWILATGKLINGKLEWSVPTFKTRKKAASLNVMNADTLLLMPVNTLKQIKTHSGTYRVKITAFRGTPCNSSSFQCLFGTALS